MLESLKNLIGFRIAATDGEIGSIEDFYFDDENWTARYMVVDTGTWLPGGKVLLSPIAIGKADRREKSVHVALTRQQIENSPDIDTDKPVSRQNEMSHSSYYGYPFYWAGPYLWGPAAYPRGVITPGLTGMEAAEPRAPDRDAAGSREEQRQSEDIHLRSVNEVSGYYIAAGNGDIGHAEDFVLDHETWSIRYMVVDTRNWLPGKKVLVAPEWIRDVSWTDKRVYVDMTREQIENSPEYDPASTLDRDYEKRLYRHYGRSGYWPR